VLARQCQIRAQRRAFRLEPFLRHLDNQLLAPAQAVLHRRAVLQGLAPSDVLEHVALLAGKVPRVHVGDVQEAVTVDPDVDEGRLNPRLDVDDAPFVDVADVGADAGAFHVEFLERAVFHDGDAALLSLGNVDQHVS
jgi:hypothetical protein